MEDDREIGAYMFRRTVPSMHLVAEDVRWMVCTLIVLMNLILTTMSYKIILQLLKT